MNKIIPHLWFDKQAKEAAEYYTKVFPNSKVVNLTTLHNTPSGDCDVVTFDLNGFRFMAISAGPLFKINPSISFILNFDPSQDKNAEKNIDTVWKKLTEGGKILMEYQEYPFSNKYGWTEDKYGVSWQLMLTDPKGEPRPFIIPSLMFVKSVYGKADSAIDFYTSVFKDSKKGVMIKYPNDTEFDKKGKIMFADFMLDNQWFALTESGYNHQFEFNEAVSFLVNCKDQKEIDYYWEKLSAVPESEQCGWLKDKFGISWQISPTDLEEMMKKGTKKQIDRVTQAFLKMKKFDLAKLKQAYG